ncbi:sialidase family protein [Flavilitoribacter nigricans]|uniref:DUF6242 domain-containing protein n=1 Tax=Flavilitoribacter nigricans (strain ATCC 23147 / DSM 23189 / NBRC 102662 / NCIMB 1420 / SS-2) TaxID=1122177 RepID=A0A2D0NJY5_FLAN2|nr:sialidase family protein [Flavilitoribacter nigricans]PHN08519.1 hypothetical protein CRP01_00995 [Flavilitoribacter nigricans DSM 23189 = NBRC 102662]
MKVVSAFFFLILGMSLTNGAWAQQAGFLYHSKDQGANWSTATAGLPANVLVNDLLTFDGKILAATNENGLFESTNGLDWKPIGKNLPPKLKAIARNGNTLLAAPWRAGILVSLDQGKTWRERNLGLFDLEVNSIITYDQLVFIGTGTGIYTSWNNGQTWMKVKSGIQADELIVQGSSLYAATPIGVFESTDRGKTWNHILEGVEVHTVRKVNNTLYVLTMRDGLLKKGPQDKTWSNGSAGLPEIGQHSFALSSSGNTLWIGYKGSIYQLKPTDKTWKKVTVPWGDGVPVMRIFPDGPGGMLVALNGRC